jgi:hypothetical protein
LPRLIPHRPGCANFWLPVPHGRASLTVALIALPVTRWQRESRRSPRKSALASSAIRCRCVDTVVRLKFSPMFPVNGSLHMAPRLPRSGPGESSSPMSLVLSRCYDFPPRLSGRLLGSLPGSTRSSLLRVSQSALPEGWRSLPDQGPCSTGDPNCRSAARGRERDLPGSQAIHPVPMPRSSTPAEPTTPRRLTVSPVLPPHIATAKASALIVFRGSITRPWHLLSTLHESCCHTHARLASGWPA